MDLSVTVQDVTASPNITAVARFCRFAFTTSDRIWSSLTKDATQILVQAPSWLDSQPLQLNCCSVSRTLQHASFTIPRDLNWLPVAARIWFQTMVLVLKAVNRTAPSTFKPWLDHTAQTEHYTLLHQQADWYRHHWEQTKSTQLFSVLEPQRWNGLPTNVRTAESLSVFCKRFQSLCSDFTSTPQSTTMLLNALNVNVSK